MAERTERPEDLLGERLGGYRLKAVAGRSSSSTVYRAEDVVLGRDVAVKLLPMWRSKTDPDRVEQFLNEARAAAQLQHPHVVTVFHVGQEGSRTFVVMEYMAGGSLQDVLDRGQRLSPEAAATAIRQACRGLLAAHQAGIIHRDIKPSNLLMTEEGVVKVADFGLANRLEVVNESGTVSVVEGTPRYLAPELCLGHPPSLASDIYAMGMTWYALLAGGPAFSGKNSQEVFRKQLRAPTPRITKLRPEVPMSHVELIECCLAKLTDDRYPSTEDLLRGLNAVLPSDPGEDQLTTAVREATSLRDLIEASRAAEIRVRETAAATTQAAATADQHAEEPSLLVPLAALVVLLALVGTAVLLFWRFGVFG